MQVAPSLSICTIRKTFMRDAELVSYKATSWALGGMPSGQSWIGKELAFAMMLEAVFMCSLNFG